MPSTDTVNVVERPYSNCLCLEWSVKEGSARNEHERPADQYDRKSDMAPIGAMAFGDAPDNSRDPGADESKKLV